MFGIGEGIYRDCEGNVYRVICTAFHTKTQEELVIYEDVTDDTGTHAMPASVWREVVCTGGVESPRFQYIAENYWELDAKPMFKLIEAIREHMEMYDRMSDDNFLAFYGRTTGDVITVSRDAMGRYEDGEDTGDYPPKMMRDIERICNAPAEFIRLPDGDEIDEYALMENFSDEAPKAFQLELKTAIRGKGAYSRFRDTVFRLGLGDDWFRYKNAGGRKEAREWCGHMKLPWAKELFTGFLPRT